MDRPSKLTAALGLEPPAVQRLRQLKMCRVVISPPAPRVQAEQPERTSTQDSTGSRDDDRREPSILSLAQA